MRTLEAIIVIIPTGYGKIFSHHLAFVMSVMSLNYNVLVTPPLKSIIKEQITKMSRNEKH